ncbi:hypothetical protein V6N12_030357 [Hibiscus sabdariffa]|uniref:Uncharacterized protein n=1 Tax=Hibiscus sabdariffa TaxID=183260 RepID=A0ABR2C1B8_9ROSI
MEMASDNNITITVQDPPPPSAPAPSESTSYSPLEDQAEISQPRDIDQSVLSVCIRFGGQPLSDSHHVKLNRRSTM